MTTKPLDHELQMAERAFNLASATGTPQEQAEASVRLSRAERAVKDNEHLTAVFMKARGP